MFTKHHTILWLALAVLPLMGCSAGRQGGCSSMCGTQVVAVEEMPAFGFAPEMAYWPGVHSGTVLKGATATGDCNCRGSQERDHAASTPPGVSQVRSTDMEGDLQQMDLEIRKHAQRIQEHEERIDRLEDDGS